MHERSRDISLPSLFSDTPDTHTNTHTLQKTEGVKIQRSLCFKYPEFKKRQQKRSLTKPEWDVFSPTHSALLLKTHVNKQICTEDVTDKNP